VGGISCAMTMLAHDRAKLATHMIAELKKPYKALTAWEEKFYLSVSMQWGAKHWISNKQFETLERIYAEKTA